MRVEYSSGKKQVQAVNGINLTLEKGESLGLVGETDANKTTTALAIMQLIPNPPGKIISSEINYKGQNLIKKSEADMRLSRSHEFSMIFQDSMTALSPMLTVGNQIAEVISRHETVTKEQAYEKACAMMEVVGIPASWADEYPHQN